MMTQPPKFRRRKEARPGEIVQAALQVFSEKGFAATKLEEIAVRAGVSKGALYLYFSSKEDLFHAVLTQAIAPNITRIRMMIESFDGPFAGMLRMLPMMMARVVTQTPVPAIAKMVIGESRNFPALARHWHDELVGPMLALMTRTIARAQARGEVHAGDPRHYALQLAGPMLIGMLWNETFAPVGAEPVAFERLAEQHVATMLRALLVEPEAPA